MIPVLSRSSSRRKAAAAAGGSFAPSDVAGLVLWLHGDGGSVFHDNGSGLFPANDGESVELWGSSTGSNDATPPATFADTSTNPTFKTGIVNGLPVIRFASTYTNALQTPLASTSDQTIFIVAKAIDVTNVERVLGAGETHSIGAFDWINGNTNGWAYYFTSAGSSIGSIPGSAAVWGVVTASISSGNLTPYYNGSAGTDFPASVTGNNWTVGASTFDGNNPNMPIHAFYGDIAEILIYDSAISSTDRAAVELYLRTKYAI